MDGSRRWVFTTQAFPGIHILAESGGGGQRSTDTKISTGSGSLGDLGQESDRRLSGTCSLVQKLLCARPVKQSLVLVQPELF